jgi:hypothetical protein
MDQGLEAVEAWLKPLLRPYAIEAYKIVRKQHGLPSLPSPTSSSPGSSQSSSTSATPYEGASDIVLPTTTIGHLALFNQHLQKANRAVEWLYSDGASEGQASKTTPVWAASVLIDGKFYGQGKGHTKKAARNEAAKEGLENLGIFVWYVRFLSLHAELVMNLDGVQIFFLETVKLAILSITSPDLGWMNPCHSGPCDQPALVCRGCVRVLSVCSMYFGVSNEFCLG